MRYERTPSRLSDGIVLEYTHEIANYKMDSALGKIYNRDIGKKLIDKITDLSTEDKKIMITLHYDSPSFSFPELSHRQKVKSGLYPYGSNVDNVIEAERISRKRGLFQKGEGVSAHIYYNPTDKTIDPEHPNELEEEGFISLAHELIHCMRYMKGTSRANNFGNYPDRESIIQEKRAIGLHQFGIKTITENNIRKEHGLPKRKSI